MSTTKARPAVSTYSPLSIARMLWKKKAAILIVWAVLSGAGLVAVWRWPAVYVSEALILVDSQKIPEKFVSSTVSSDLQDRLATINQQILSTTRLKKVIEDFNLYQKERQTRYEEEVLETMRADISVRLVKGWIGSRPGAFRVGFQGPDAAITAQVANRIANLYIEENLKTREVQAEGTSEFIDVQLQDAKKRLDELEAAVSLYKVRHTGQLPEQQNALLGALSGLHVQLEANRDALNRAQQAKMALELNLQTLEDARDTFARATAAASTPGAVVTGDGAIAPAPVKRQSKALEEQLDLMKVRLTDQHPDVKRLEEDIRNLKALENAKSGEPSPLPDPAALSAGGNTTESGKRPTPAKGADPTPGAPKLPVSTASQIQWNARIQDLKGQAAMVATELENRRADQAKILQEIAANQAKVDKLPVREQEMAALMRDYELSKAHYKSLFDKKSAAEMSTDMERRQKSERFTIIDPAPVPMLPAKPNRPLFGGLAIALGLVIGLAVGIGGELRRDALLGEWELPAGTVILARLPHFTFPVATGSESPRKRRPRRLRPAVVLAIVSCLTLGLIGAAAGMYFMSHRF